MKSAPLSIRLDKQLRSLLAEGARRTSFNQPVKTLFDYLENNYSLAEFLECFPSVTNEMARHILERSETAL